MQADASTIANETGTSDKLKGTDSSMVNYAPTS